MSNEYKVIRISEQEPKKYDGQYGTTYYIKVMLEGHEKPVEIGKKTPDALKAGDTVYGSITATEYQTDKFKGEQKPFEGSKGSFNKVEDPAKQDSIIRQSSMKASIDLVSNGKIELDELYTRADEIVAWVKGELSKNESTDSKATETPQLVKPDSLKSVKEKAQEMSNSELGDFDTEEINLDDIQF